MSGFSVRGGGKVNSRAHIEARRAKVMEGMEQGLTQADLVDELQVSRSTLWRDLAALRERWSGEADQSFAEYRKKQMEVLELIEEAIVGGLILPEVANAWRAVRADISKLLGLDQPTRHVTARVNVDADPPALRLKQAVGGLDDDQLEEVARFAASLARKPAVKGEDWFPAKPKGELPQ